MTALPLADGSGQRAAYSASKFALTQSMHGNSPPGV